MEIAIFGLGYLIGTIVTILIAEYKFKNKENKK